MLELAFASMNTFVQIALVGICSAFICAISIPLLASLAQRIGLVDKPDKRKQHTGSIPLVGGIAITAAIFLTLGAFGLIDANQFLLISACFLTLLGAWDDKFDINPRYRLIIQISVGLAIVYIGGIQISSIGNLTGDGIVVLTGFTAVIFTVLCSVGVFNSINMIDGIDGLAASLVIITLSALLILASLAGDTASTPIIAALIGACLAFLVFNLEVLGVKNKVFLGDAGSLFLGFFLLWFFIALTQGPTASMSPVVAGWLFGLPLVDTVSVIVSRLMERRHPFAAGRDHIHHRLQDYGYTASKTLRILLAYHGLLVVIGVISNRYQDVEPYLFWLFVLVTIAHFFVQRQMNKKKSRLTQAVAGKSNSARIVKQSRPT